MIKKAPNLGTVEMHLGFNNVTIFNICTTIQIVYISSVIDIPETKLIQEMTKKIGKTGNTAAIYIPSKIREYLPIGDEITLNVVIRGNQLEFVIHKMLYNFEVVDMQSVSDERGFEMNYNKTVEDVIVLEAAKGDTTLSYTQNCGDGVQPARVAVSKKITDVDHNTYNNIMLWAKQRKKLDVVIRPEGDLDTINVLKDPGRYRLTMEKAFNLLKESGKEIGVLVTCRFDSKNNTVEEIKYSIDELSNLNPRSLPYQ